MRLVSALFILVIVAFLALLISVLNPHLNSYLQIPFYHIPKGDLNVPQTNERINTQFQPIILKAILDENKSGDDGIKTFCDYKAYGSLTTRLQESDIYLLSACADYSTLSGLLSKKHDPQYMVMIIDPTKDELVNFIKISAYNNDTSVYNTLFGYRLSKIFPPEIYEAAIQDRNDNGNSVFDDIYTNIDNQAQDYFYRSKQNQ